MDGVLGSDVGSDREQEADDEPSRCSDAQRSPEQPHDQARRSGIERLPAERITTRAIAEESDANVASIAYHFGSKDDLVTAAVVEGLDQWLEEIGNALGDLDARSPRERLRAALAVIETTRERLSLIHI